MGQGAGRPRAARADSIAFQRRTEREFWVDPDGTNRWSPAFTGEGAPLIEDHAGGEEECSACGTQIRWLCFVTGATLGVKPVERCCIRKVIRALPEAEEGPCREALVAINREMRNAVPRSQGKPIIIGREERLRSQIVALETASSDHRIFRATWLYNGNERSVMRDVTSFLQELKEGKRHTSFQFGLSWALSRIDLSGVFT